MRRTVIWSAALVVVLVMVGVAWFSAATTTRVAHAAAVTPFSGVSLGGANRFEAPLAIPPPPGGISRDQAIAIAGNQEHLGRDAVESAVVGSFFSYAPGVSVQGSSPHQLVWAVTFSGVFVPPCMAPPSPCVPSHHETLLLDYYTGTVLLFILRQ